MIIQSSPKAVTHQAHITALETVAEIGYASDYESRLAPSRTLVMLRSNTLEGASHLPLT